MKPRRLISFCCPLQSIDLPPYAPFKFTAYHVIDLFVTDNQRKCDRTPTYSTTRLHNDRLNLHYWCFRNRGSSSQSICWGNLMKRQWSNQTILLRTVWDLLVISCIVCVCVVIEWICHYVNYYTHSHVICSSSSSGNSHKSTPSSSADHFIRKWSCEDLSSKIVLYEFCHHTVPNHSSIHRLTEAASVVGINIEIKTAICHNVLWHVVVVK